MQAICLASVIVKTETTPPSTADCVELLRSVQQLNRARRRATKYKQDAGALMMMSALEGTPGARVSALAEMLMVDISAASRQISALETAGLVARVKDEVDHRAQLVRLTPAGEAALLAACDVAGSDLAGRLTHWSDADILALTGLIRRLAIDLVASEPGCARSHPTAVRPAAPVGG